MCLNGLEYRRTHDLEELAGQLEDLGVSPPFSANEWRRLSPYAVEYRYDDEAPELLTPLQARSIVHHVLTWCESQIPAAA
jgi:HEPN domain-containing protein